MTCHAEAVVDTARASRYLDQLCRHADQMSRMPGHRPRAHGDGLPPPEVRRVDWGRDRGTISFAGGECTLLAGPATLTLSLDADDDEALQRIQTLLGRRLETIGRRDGLDVPWAPPPGDRSDPRRGRTTHLAHRRGRHLPVAAAAAVLVLIVAAHVGLGGAILDSAWTGWTVAAVVVVLLAKLTVLVLGHARLRRRL